MCIIGVGLIGGSLARAAKIAGVVNNIVGTGRDHANLVEALDLGVIDEFSLDIKQAVSKADLIVIATPVGAIKSVLEEIADSIPENAVITDVGSTKGSVVDAAKAVFGELPTRFIPGHPIAGNEKSGVIASFIKLFHGRRVILTPQLNSDLKSLEKIKALWAACGAEVVLTSVEQHDIILAATSHLPHVLAFSLVNTLDQMDNKNDIFKFAAGGFEDFTRIASSNPQMWSDICIANKDALTEVLNKFSEDLEFLKLAINSQNAEQIRELFQRAKKVRDSVKKVFPAVY
ncbi:Cyclohexadienyl dehydrogenase [hydrothermal vent metagenome]|uniref:Cyclohexadienyl dehydrogenase n=1 Tax=hydrothermal vent metagenome TaxID=652676 RepID=A0A3B0ZWK7_9ZZZZ